MTHTQAAPFVKPPGAAIRIRSGYFIFTGKKVGEDGGVVCGLDMLGIYGDNVGYAPHFAPVTALKDISDFVTFDTKREARMVSRWINKNTPWVTMVGLRIWQKELHQYLPVYQGYGYKWVSQLLLLIATLNFKFWK